jgi:excisionase family DNA binding protein
MDSITYLNADEASKLIKVKKETIYHYTHMKKIPHIKVGKKIVFELDELISWMNARKVAERKILGGRH